MISDAETDCGPASDPDPEYDPLSNAITGGTHGCPERPSVACSHGSGSDFGAK
jgi:hypothetical protein